ncbi:MAG: hypothetical protein ABMA64_10460 [Myxococcota bacterium]
MLGWLAAAWAQDPLTTELLSPRLDEALRSERDGDLRQAAFLYELARLEQPNINKATLGLGRVWVQLGRVESALHLYESAPYDPDLVEAEGRLLLDLRRHDEAAPLFARLVQLRPEWPGARALEARARAPSEPDRAAGLLEEYLEFEEVDPIEDEAEVAVREVCAALQDRGDHAAATGLLLDVLARFPELTGLSPILADLEVDARARALAEASDVPLTPAQAERLRRAREAFAAGAVRPAREALEALAIDQPASAVIWATLGDVREAEDDPAGAEQAFAAAERLDPLDASYPAKRGQILSRAFAGRYDEEAMGALARAVLRRARDPELWYAKAVVERRAGARARANASWARVLDLEPAGPHADEARTELAAYRRERAAPALLPPATGRPDEVPAGAWRAYHRARAWIERPEPDATDRALTELARARELAPGFVPAIELLAAIRADRGDVDGAIALYEESARLTPDRGRVLGRLATLYEQAGRPAEAAAARDQAATLGDPEALWRRARDQADAWRWTAARATLSELFVRASSGPAYERALQLDAELAERIRLGWLGGGAAAAVGLVAPIAVAIRRRSGVDLGGLLDRAPQTWRDVARICSAIRHEVLKHHVSVVPEAAAALRDGDPEPALWMFDRILGAEGAVERLNHYVDALEDLARTHGVRLNLRRRDPVFGPMLRAFAELEAIGAAVRSARSGPRLAGRLERASAALNGDAYRGLGALLAHLGTLTVDRELLEEVYASVRDEPGFRGEVFPQLVVHAPEPARIRMYRADLVDVLTNLVRNAARATLAAGGDRIGLALGVEEDEVTALESVAIAVADPAPGGLTTAMLRERAVERGLGLALELAARAGGSIRVEAGSPEGPWAKVVVVSIPRVEAGGGP